MASKAKIICTLGPASDSVTVLRNMMRAGMDVCRLNFSHGSHRDHAQRIAAVRGLNRKYRRHIRILQDLEGLRIRIGDLKAPVPLTKRQTVLLSNLKGAGGPIIPFDYEGDIRKIKKGSLVFIDDGQIALLVTKVTRRALTTRVVMPGTIKPHKGINIPGIKLTFKDLTAKDKRDIAFGIAHRVDFVAQSFVRNAQDILRVREALGPYQKKCRVIAKIENEEGIGHIDGILEVADGIMIARGDLGVSLPIYQVPVLQKRIIKKCRRLHKFTITATQMLESMTEHARPTRAEVSDVANAVLDGSDYVMLSEETAAGRFPVETVKMMDQIIKFTEGASLLK